MADSINFLSMPLSTRHFKVSKIIVSIFSAADSSTSLSPHTNMESLLSAWKPVPSDRAVPSSESINALRKGEAEFPRRICSSSIRARISKKSLISAVRHAMQTWHFFDGSSLSPSGYLFIIFLGLFQRGWERTSVLGSIRSNFFKIFSCMKSRCSFNGIFPYV